MKFIVYCHTNKLNGKAYIGWTNKSIDVRWREHCGASKKSLLHFHLAIKKYGVGDEIWQHEILDVLAKQKGAKRAEIVWIEHRKTTNFHEGHFGYNMTDGGDGAAGFKYTDVQRQNIKRIRAEMKDVHRLNNTGEKNPMFGRKQSAASKEKNRLSNIKTHNSPEVLEANRQANIRTHNLPEVKERNSRLVREALARPEVKAKMKRNREIRSFRRKSRKWLK